MNIRPIRTKKDYQRALKRVEALMGAKANTPQGDELDVLATLVEVFEARNYKILPSNPIEAIQQCSNPNLNI